MRRYFTIGSVLIVLLNGVIAAFYPPILWSMVVFTPLLMLGFYDLLQKKHAVLRNFPLIGHFRYIAEAIRPEISQYFIESDTNGVPFNREQRSIVYQRAKKARDTVPFGTKKDVYEVGSGCSRESTARRFKIKSKLYQKEKCKKNKTKL